MPLKQIAHSRVRQPPPVIPSGDRPCLRRPVGVAWDLVAGLSMPVADEFLRDPRERQPFLSLDTNLTRIWLFGRLYQRRESPSYGYLDGGFSHAMTGAERGLPAIHEIIDPRSGAWRGYKGIAFNVDNLFKPAFSREPPSKAE